MDAPPKGNSPVSVRPSRVSATLQPTPSLCDVTSALRGAASGRTPPPFASSAMTRSNVDYYLLPSFMRLRFFSKGGASYTMKTSKPGKPAAKPGKPAAKPGKPAAKPGK